MKILGVTGLSDNADIDVSDVLIWSINETYADLRRSMPLWAAQGMRFERQRRVWDKATSGDGIALSEKEAQKFLEQEAVSIEERYRPRDDAAGADELFRGSEGNPRVAEIRGRCERFDSTKFTAAALQEEQERELSPEVEAERQVERPKPAKALSHKVHEDVRTFIRTGAISSIQPAFKPAFGALYNTSAAAYFDPGEFPQDLLVTSDFARTVESSGASVQMDAYQRPVQWVVTTRSPCCPGQAGAQQEGTRKRMVVVIISPFEAEALMPDIERSAAVFLHLYGPRSNPAFRPLDHLTLYTLPPLPRDWRAPPAHLVLLLNLFAGQLYFRSHDEYSAACEFLSLSWRPVESGQIVQPDGFIDPAPGDVNCRFRASPTRFLQVLLATIRRDGRGIGKTHWGRVLAGEILKEDDFEDGDVGMEDEEE